MFFIGYDGDPQNLFSAVKYILVGTTGRETTKDFAEQIQGLDEAEYRDKPHTFVFEAEYDGFELIQMVEGKLTDMITGANGTGSGTPTYTFDVDGHVYTELEQLSETEFYATGYHHDLYAPVALATTSKAPKCQHVRGSTQIYGRWICKICGDDLD